MDTDYKLPWPCRRPEGPLRPDELPEAITLARRYAQQAFKRKKWGTRYLSVSDCAWIACSGLDKIYARVKDGTLVHRWKGRKGAGGSRLIDLGSFERWLEVLCKPISEAPNRLPADGPGPDSTPPISIPAYVELGKRQEEMVRASTPIPAGWQSPRIIDRSNAPRERHLVCNPVPVKSGF
jgi:hypothetical protein